MEDLVKRVIEELFGFMDYMEFDDLGMYIIDFVDYGIIMFGWIILELDDGE